MSVVQWNLRGYRSNGDDLDAICRMYDTKIVMLQETKLRPKQTINLTRFKAFHRNVAPEPGGIAHGGVCILADPGISPVRIFIDSPLQVVAVKVNIVRPIVICSLYIQERDRVTKSEIQSVIDQLGDCFILGGDFNAHSPAWAHPDYNSLGEIVEEIMIENNLLLLNNGEATHLNKATGNWSAIDLTFSKGMTNATDWHTHPDLANSDHLPIVFSLHRWNNSAIAPEPRFQEHKADWDRFQQLSENISIDLQESEPITTFTHAILQVAERSIPKSIEKSTTE